MSLLHLHMREPLPSITAQKRLLYRPTIKEVQKFYDIINCEVFDNILPPTKLVIKSHCRGYWGKCHADDFNRRKRYSQCVITLSDKWYCKQWLLNTLAHEMAHQYQWDVYGKERCKINRDPVLNHGPSFYQYKERLAQYGIILKRTIRSDKWFKYQQLHKC